MINVVPWQGVDKVNKQHINNPIDNTLSIWTKQHTNHKQRKYKKPNSS